MTVQPSRREALSAGLTAASGLLLTGRAGAIPPPMATKYTTALLLAAANLKPAHKLVERSGEFREGSPARCPAFSPDGKLAAVGGSHLFAGVWEVATGKRVLKLGEVTALAFRPTGALVTTQVANYDSPTTQAVCAEWAAGKKEPAELFKHRMDQLVFSPDGGLLAGRTIPGKAGGAATQVLSVPGGKEAFGAPYDDAVFAVSAGRLVTGKLPRKAGGSWTVRVWGKDGKAVGDIRGAPPVAAGDKLVVLRGADAGEVVLWDPVAGTKAVLKHRHAELSTVGLSADGKRLATAGPRELSPPDDTYRFPLRRVAQVVTVWDLAAGKAVASAEVGDVRFDRLVFSPDDKQLLASGSEVVMGRSAPHGPCSPAPPSGW